MMKIKRRTAACLALAAACGLSTAARAIDYEWSGFASAIAGRTSGSCTPDNMLSSTFNAACTRYVADWAHAGVYDDRWSIEPESKLGLQGTVRFAQDVSVTGQVVARLVDGHPTADLEWAYATWSPSPSWTFQAGRKRLPLFYYSDFQDVGYAYPWLRVPPDVYGWDVVNYNGASATFNTSVSQWTVRSSVFGGAENSRKNPFSRITYDDGKDVKWSRIAGADLEVNRDWFTARLVYVQSDFQQVDRASGEPDVLPSGQTRGHHKAYGGSINVDYDNWIVRTEYSIFDRNQYEYKANAWFISAGYRIGRFTPMVTASNYRESTRWPDTYAPARWNTRSVTLRYDFGKSSDVKIQLDRMRDPGSTLPGSANVFAVSYDVVF